MLILVLILAYVFINRSEFEASDYLWALKKNTSEFKAVHKRIFI